MQAFKYETHAHSLESSSCSGISAAELVQFYSMSGFSGLCITDHLDYYHSGYFLKASGLVPEEVPWADRVELFCRGYESALAAGIKIGLDVFFGWEFSARGSHLFTYGLDKQWLLGHADLLDLDPFDYCDLVHSDGGLVAHAHPFREDQYMREIRLYPRHVDAVEVTNACRSDFQNRCADQYADNYGLLKIAGSDNHRGPLKRLGGMKLTRRPNDVVDMIREIRNGQAECFVGDIDALDR